MTCIPCKVSTAQILERIHKRTAAAGWQSGSIIVKHTNGPQLVLQQLDQFVLSWQIEPEVLSCRASTTQRSSESRSTMQQAAAK